MIGGGGSTANRAAADVIGAGAAGDACPRPSFAGRAELAGVELSDELDIPRPDDPRPDDARPGDARLGDDARCGALDTSDGIDGTDGRKPLARRIASTSAGAASPRKSFTRVSTSWLIEMLLASQNALSRS